jgi:hypothetical protein
MKKHAQFQRLIKTEFFGEMHTYVNFDNQEISYYVISSVTRNHVSGHSKKADTDLTLVLVMTTALVAGATD